MWSERISNRMGNRFDMIRLWIQLILVNTCTVRMCLINYVCISNCVAYDMNECGSVCSHLFRPISFHFMPCHSVPYDSLPSHWPFRCTTSICSHSKYNLVIKYARNSRVEIAISHGLIHTSTHARTQTHRGHTHKYKIECEWFDGKHFLSFYLLTHLTYFSR